MLKVIILALLATVALARQQVKLVGHTDCGSEGRLIEVELTNCEQAPCDFDPKEILDLGIIFVASSSSSSPVLRTSAVAFGQEHDIRDTIIDGEIEQGEAYLFEHSFQIGDFFSGLRTTIKFEILRGDDDNGLEICLQAPMNVGE